MTAVAVRAKLVLGLLVQTRQRDALVAAGAGRRGRGSRVTVRTMTVGAPLLQPAVRRVVLGAVTCGAGLRLLTSVRLMTRRTRRVLRNCARLLFLVTSRARRRERTAVRLVAASALRMSGVRALCFGSMALPAARQALTWMMR
jgi:hypothetical protein